MSSILKIILRSGKDEAVRRFHPWVFSGAIKKIDGPAYDGVHAEVFSNKEEYLGAGIYQDAAIAVRLLAFAPERPRTFDQTFWEERIRAAYGLRKDFGLTHNPQTNVYRLVHGEGDHMPGLIIDHYDGHLVIQLHATGLCPNIHHIAEALKATYGNQLKSIYDKSTSTLPGTGHDSINKKEATDLQEGDAYEIASMPPLPENYAPGSFLYGHAGDVEVLEEGHRFMVDIIRGQKTGFFIDQRENRLLLTRYCQGKKVLNTFCYSGGFSVYGLAAGASEMHSLDSSASAMELTNENIRLNFGSDKSHTTITSDAIHYLRQASESYDLIILDPPAFAKHVHVRHKAVQGYKRLNQIAIESIRPGGIIFTFSCSQVVDMNLFRATVLAAAILANRKVRILHQMTQAPDHPVNLFHPEGQYLKGLVLRVD